MKICTNSDPGMKLSFEVTARDFAAAGEVSSKIKRVLRQIGFPAQMIRRSAIIAYEAEMNLVIHSVGGQMFVEVFPDRIEIRTEDPGPGIPNLELAMTEGYSTASEEIREMGFGAGMGLPNIRNCADEFHIESKQNVGTKLIATIFIGDSGDHK